MNKIQILTIINHKIQVSLLTTKHTTDNKIIRMKILIIENPKTIILNLTTKRLIIHDIIKIIQISRLHHQKIRLIRKAIHLPIIQNKNTCSFLPLVCLAQQHA